MARRKKTAAQLLSAYEARNEAHKKRYQTDPEFREARKAYARQYVRDHSDEIKQKAKERYEKMSVILAGLCQSCKSAPWKYQVCKPCFENGAYPDKMNGIHRPHVEECSECDAAKELLAKSEPV